MNQEVNDVNQQTEYIWFHNEIISGASFNHISTEPGQYLRRLSLRNLFLRIFVFLLSKHFFTVQLFLSNIQSVQNTSSLSSGSAIATS